MLWLLIAQSGPKMEKGRLSLFWISAYLFLLSKSLILFSNFLFCSITCVASPNAIPAIPKATHAIYYPPLFFTNTSITHYLLIELITPFVDKYFFFVFTFIKLIGFSLLLNCYR